MTAKSKKKPVKKIVKKKKNKLDQVEDVIFDSKIGKTDALFASEPEEKPKAVLPAISKIDPDIDQALKEFDNLEKPKMENKNMNLPKEAASVPPGQDYGEPRKKSFWKKIFSLNGKLFSLFIGLVFAGVFCAGVYVFAVAGVDTPFAPGSTLNPACTPGATNCTVSAPLTDSFTGNFTGTGDLTTTGSFHVKSNDTYQYFGSADQAKIYYSGSLNAGGLVIDPGSGTGVNLLTIGNGTRPSYQLEFKTSGNYPGIITYTGSTKSFDFGNNTGNTILTTGLSMENAGGDVLYTLPTADGTVSGQVLTTNASGALSWTTINALPTQTSNSGKYLTTNGTSASWATVTAGISNSADFYVNTSTHIASMGTQTPALASCSTYSTSGTCGAHTDNCEWVADALGACSTYNGNQTNCEANGCTYQTAACTSINDQNGCETNCGGSGAWSDGNSCSGFSYASCQDSYHGECSLDPGTDCSPLSTPGQCTPSGCTWTSTMMGQCSGYSGQAPDSGCYAHSGCTWSNPSCMYIANETDCSSAGCTYTNSYCWDMNGSCSGNYDDGAGNCTGHYNSGCTSTYGYCPGNGTSTYYTGVCTGTAMHCANKGAVTATTPALAVGGNSQLVVDGHGNLTTTASGTFGNGVISSYAVSAPTLTTNGQIGVAYVGSAARLYFRANGTTWYIDKTGGFGIPAHETSDPISGEKMKIGDIVMGMVDQNMGDGGTPATSSLHGIWVKWDSVKEELLAEARGELLNSSSGSYGSGLVWGVKTETLLDKVKNALIALGVNIKDGVLTVSKFATDSLTAKTASIDIATLKKLQMIDETTGKVYCMVMKGGELVKTEGSCSDVEIPPAVSILPQATAPTDETSVDQTTSSAQEKIFVQVDSSAVEISPTTGEPVSPAEEPVIGPQAVNILENAGANLLTGAWNFVKLILEKPIRKLSELPIIKNMAADLLQNVEIIQQGFSFKNLWHE